MAQLIFKTKHVPDDECMAIRCLLVDNNILFHETGAGLLGLSIAGLWVDSDEASAARTLIDAEQAVRKQQVDQSYQENPRSFFGLFIANPMKWLGSVFAIVGLLGLVLLPFYFLQP